MDTTVQSIDISALRYIPELMAWVIGIVLATIMVRRGGVKAENLLLVGCCLIFVAGIISLLLGSIMPWIREREISAQEFGLIMSISGIPSLAGLICLVLAFWFRFRTRKQEAA